MLEVLTSWTTATFTTVGMTRLTSGANDGIVTAALTGPDWFAAAGAESAAGAGAALASVAGLPVDCAAGEPGSCELQNGNAPARANAIAIPSKTPPETATTFLNIHASWNQPRICIQCKGRSITTPYVIRRIIMRRNSGGSNETHFF